MFKRMTASLGALVAIATLVAPAAVAAPAAPAAFDQYQATVTWQRPDAALGGRWFGSLALFGPDPSDPGLVIRESINGATCQAELRPTGTWRGAIRADLRSATFSGGLTFGVANMSGTCPAASELQFTTTVSVWFIASGQALTADESGQTRVTRRATALVRIGGRVLRATSAELSGIRFAVTD